MPKVAISSMFNNWHNFHRSTNILPVFWNIFSDERTVADNCISVLLQLHSKAMFRKDTRILLIGFWYRLPSAYRLLILNAHGTDIRCSEIIIFVGLQAHVIKTYKKKQWLQIFCMLINFIKISAMSVYRLFDGLDNMR